MGRKKGSKNKVKPVEPVSIPYERSTSDDPLKQSLIDLIETGRSATQFTNDGIRRIDPLSSEAAVALYNAEHPDQFTSVEEIPIKEFEKKYGQVIKGHFNDVANGRDEKPLPENWNKMGKVDKLKWLTANRK